MWTGKRSGDISESGDRVLREGDHGIPGPAGQHFNFGEALVAS
jgi:hypothetical protein